MSNDHVRGPGQVTDPVLVKQILETRKRLWNKYGIEPDEVIETKEQQADFQNRIEKAETELFLDVGAYEKGRTNKELLRDSIELRSRQKERK